MSTLAAAPTSGSGVDAENRQWLHEYQPPSPSQQQHHHVTVPVQANPAGDTNDGGAESDDDTMTVVENFDSLLPPSQITITTVSRETAAADPLVNGDGDELVEHGGTASVKQNDAIVELTYSDERNGGFVTETLPIQSEAEKENNNANRKKAREGRNATHRSGVSGAFKPLSSSSSAPLKPNAVFLCLAPLNHTFTRKCIKVPFYPSTMLLGRQINSRTVPTPENGYFDSRVLSRQHAEIWADRTSGSVWIRDIKSSNGTFVNGTRLSREGVDSEPFELKPDDIIDLGIDISNDDSKTVLHNKVSAKVEKVGFSNSPPVLMQQAGSSGGMFSSTPISNGGSVGLSYADIDPNSKFLTRGQVLHPFEDGVLATASLSTFEGPGKTRQRIVSRMIPTVGSGMKGPISLDMIIKKINKEMQMAKAQGADLQRATQMLEAMAKSQAASISEAVQASEREMAEMSSAEVAVAAADVLATSVDSTADAEKQPEQDVSTQSGLHVQVHPPHSPVRMPSAQLSPLVQASPGAVEQKFLTLSLSLSSLEQQLADANQMIQDLEWKLQTEVAAREQAESKFALVQKELELEREEAISDLRAEEEDEVKIAIEDSAAADTIALIDKEEELQRRRRASSMSGESSGGSSSSGEEDETRAMARAMTKLERELQTWKARAVKAENLAEDQARTMERFLRQMQAENGTVSSSSSSSSLSREQRNGDGLSLKPRVEVPPEEQPIPRSPTLTPSQFKHAREYDGTTMLSPPSLRHANGKRKQHSRDKTVVACVKEEGGGRVIATTADAKGALMIPLASSMTIVAIGISLMLAINEWTRAVK
ncbi:uncharacterized protein V1518DRAFT_431272 [Limtongia smithiae]|uniref:uncharacterized protein n=1 Tax=Limtongia smithiae TaxID=1125753 RepID=UPI0034CDAFC7